MAFWKTYKSISAKGVINGVSYELERYTPYYYALERIVKDDSYYEKSEVNLAEFILKKGHNSLSASMCVDQYGNEWYRGDELYIAYADGKKLNTEPKSYYSACQLISEDASLINKHYISGYEYCYDKLSKCYNEREHIYYMDEYVPNYDDMFEIRFKIGDTAYYVQPHTEGTYWKEICSFIVRGINVGGGKVELSSKSDMRYFGWDDVVKKQDFCYPSVEMLCDAYKPSTLYVKRGYDIVPCNTTKEFEKK